MRAFIVVILLFTSSYIYAADNIEEKNKISTLYPSDIKPELLIKPDARQCIIQIDKIVDDRKDKKIAGVLFGRPLYTPDDNEQWLRSVIESLKARKIVFSDSETSVDKEQIKIVSFNLFKMWVTNTGRNSSATVLMYMTHGETKKLYRGGNVRGLSWSSGPKKMQKTLNVAIGQALDKMAIDIHEACGNKVILKDK